MSRSDTQAAIVAASHVAVDEHDGYTFWRGADGELFTHQTARAFADQRNAEMKPEHRRYQVYSLVHCPGIHGRQGRTAAVTAGGGQR